MAKSLGLRKFFAQARKRIPIKVGNQLVEFTATQAVRLSDLADTRKDSPTEPAAGPPNTDAFSLEDAAFRLLISEDALLAAAADGRQHLYVDISGLRGRWMSKSEDQGVVQSSVHVPSRGYLALMQQDAATLAEAGRCAVKLLTYSPAADAEALNLPNAVLGELRGWGNSRKHFRLEKPLHVTREQVRLLPPLADNDG